MQTILTASAVMLPAATSMQELFVWHRQVATLCQLCSAMLRRLVAEWSKPLELTDQPSTGTDFCELRCNFICNRLTIRPIHALHQEQSIIALQDSQLVMLLRYLVTCKLNIPPAADHVDLSRLSSLGEYRWSPSHLRNALLSTIWPTVVILHGMHACAVLKACWQIIHVYTRPLNLCHQQRA